jgi:CHASE3 domain sensor protein
MSLRSIVRPRSLRVPTFAALALIATVVTAMFATLVFSVRTLEASSQAGRKTSQMTQDTLALERVVVDLETGVRGYMLTGDRQFLAPYFDGRMRLVELVRDMQSLSPPESRPAVDRIAIGLDSYVREYAEPLARGEGSESVLAATNEGKRRLDALRLELAALTRAQQQVTTARRARSQALRERMIVVGAAGALGSVVLLVLLGLALHRFVLVPVRRVARAA